MSVYYDIREHIIIKDTNEHMELADMFIYRIACLGRSLLLDGGKIIQLTVVTDGEKSEFSGDTLNEKFHSIIRAMSSAGSLEVIADYGYYHYTTDVQGPDVFDIADFLDERIAEDGEDYLDGMFYSMYNNADCSSDAGAVVAYGKKNGAVYKGTIEKKTIDTLPDGVWYSPQTAVVYEEESENAEEIEAICREMTKFSSYDVLEAENNEVMFYLNNLELHNNDELVEFIGLCNKLLKATSGKATADINLADLKGDDGRIAEVAYNDDGTYEIALYSAE